MYYQVKNEEVFVNAKQQQFFFDKLQKFLIFQQYQGLFILCGDFLLGIDEKGRTLPCIPENFPEDELALNLCRKMNKECFNTKFSFFSLQMGLQLFSSLETPQQLLLLVDDKYVSGEQAQTFFVREFNALPNIYYSELMKHFPSEEALQEHLHFAVQNVSDHTVQQTSPLNEFLISERYLVRRFGANRDRKTTDMEYNAYYDSLGADFKSCCLDIFQLLTVLKKRKQIFFPSLSANDKVVIVIFVPDACTSSAMLGGLAVSKTDSSFDIINITQNTTMGEDLLMMLHISQGGVERL
jgi:hypothetical protein